MKAKVKIVLFAPEIYTGGGTERVLVSLANELVTEWNVVIAVNSIGKKLLYPLNEAVKIKEYKFGRLRKYYQKNILVKIVNKLLGKFILRLFLTDPVFENASLIISFSPAITYDCYNTKFKDRLISFEHWPFSAYNRYPKAQDQIRKFFPHLRKVIVLTEHEKRIYESLGCNVIMIPNALTFFPEEPSGLENKIVLSIGHFNEQKRRDLLIQSWDLVHKEHPDWKLHIVGDGPLKKESVKQIQVFGLNDSIKIINPTKDILNHYLMSSIYVLSSAFEALPLVLLEAKAVGLPCVSFDIVSGPNEIIQDKKDGFLIEFPDIEKMADKIGTLIKDKSLRTRFGQTGRQDVQNRFNSQTIYALWQDFLQHEIN